MAGERIPRRIDTRRDHNRALNCAPGEKLDRVALTPLSLGIFVHLPGRNAALRMADGETIVQINGMGPFDVTYVDPKDDPRKP